MATRWTFLTNHAHVLLCLSMNPNMTLREVADKVGITERAAHRIVGELEEGGVLERERVGRRNHYEVNLDAPLRHPLEQKTTVGGLLQVLRASNSLPGSG